MMLNFQIYALLPLTRWRLMWCFISPARSYRSLVGNATAPQEGWILFTVPEKCPKPLQKRMAGTFKSRFWSMVFLFKWGDFQVPWKCSKVSVVISKNFFMLAPDVGETIQFDFKKCSVGSNPTARPDCT